MTLLEKFAETFPSSVDHYSLKREMYWSVQPCLFYGRLIDCQLRKDKYSRKGCYQDQIKRCWEQEAHEHLPQHITEKILNKFNKTY